SVGPSRERSPSRWGERLRPTTWERGRGRSHRGAVESSDREGERALVAAVTDSPSPPADEARGSPTPAPRRIGGGGRPTGDASGGWAAGAPRRGFDRFARFAV